ncbi:MAG: hypothetical protein ACPGSL_04850 [Vicingaceae bacterium]
METATAKFYIEDDIIYMRAKKDADFTLEATKEGVEVRRVLQKNKPMLCLIDTRSVFQVSKESSAYGASKEVSELSIAMAILTGSSLATILIGNFFIKFNKPLIPTKMFKQEEKAIQWLNSFKK